jgi:hypothetical protein
MNAISARLSAQSSDEDFARALQAMPGLLHATQAEAERAFNLLARTPFAANLRLPEFWTLVQVARRRARDEAYVARNPADLQQRAAVIGQLKILMRARDEMAAVVSDLARLTPAEARELEARDLLPEPRMAAVRALSVRHAGLAAWSERRDAEAAEDDARQMASTAQLQAAQEAERQQAAAAAARTLLRRLAADGVSLTVSRGELLAHPPAMLTPDHRAAIATHRADLLEVLSAKPEAVA